MLDNHIDFGGRYTPHDTVILKLGNLRSLESLSIKWIAHNIFLNSLLEPRNKIVIDTLLDINPGTSST